MRHDGKEIGFPSVPYKNTTAAIEALTGVDEGAMAYSTDDNVFGTYNGATWDWATGGGDVATDAIWDAKGDIAGGTGANAAAALPVGTDGYVLTANSGAATGLAWAAAGSGDMANDALWDAKGDIAIGSGNNAGDNLAVGADGQFFEADSGETLGVKYGVPSHPCEGRLTLTTAVPITTSDVTAATTLYFTPCIGNKIGLYDAAKGWTIISFTELSLDISGYTADKNYDIWVYNNAGTPTLDSTIWTDNTTRATALAYQDGILIKNGDATRRYLGTIRITATTGQCEDSDTKRFVYNRYNRVPRRATKTDSTGHTYGSAAARYWNNDSAHKIEYVCGVADEFAPVNLILGLASSSSGKKGIVSPGYNQVATAGYPPSVAFSGTAYLEAGSSFVYKPTLGYSYIAVLESAVDAINVTFSYYRIGIYFMA